MSKVIKLNDDTYASSQPPPTQEIADVQQAEADFCNEPSNNGTLIDWQALAYGNTHYSWEGLLDGGIILFNTIKDEY